MLPCRRPLLGSLVLLPVALMLQGALVLPSVAAGDAPSVKDPAVVTLAEDRGISLAEAQQRIGWQQALNEVDDELAGSLGENFGGAWVDNANGDRVVVALTSAADDADQDKATTILRRVGLDEVSQRVSVANSLATLKQQQRLLADEVLGTRGQSGQASALGLGLDLPHNDIVVEAPPSEQRSAGEEQAIRHARARGPVTVRERSIGMRKDACNASGLLNCDPSTRGGLFIQTPVSTTQGEDCSVGFYVTSKSNGLPYMLTAGHCFPTGGGTPRGFNADGSRRDYGYLQRALANDPNGDYAIFGPGSTGWNPRPLVAVLDRGQTAQDLTYYISDDQYANAGTRVCFTGGRTRTTRCGDVTDNSYVFNGQYLQRANYCDANAGDSGGPVFASHTAYGIHTATITVGGVPQSCDKLFTSIVSAENTLNVNVVHGTS